MICVPAPCLEMCDHYSDFPGLSAWRPPKLQKAKRPRHLVALHCISASFWTFIQFFLSYDIYDVFRKFHLLNRTLQTLSKVSYTKLFFQSGSFSIHLFVEADTDVAARNSSNGSQAMTNPCLVLNITITSYQFIPTAYYVQTLFVVLFVFLTVIVLHFINIYSVRAFFSSIKHNFFI